MACKGNTNKVDHSQLLPSLKFDVQGVLYHDRMKPSELEKVRPQLAALEEAFIAAHPGVEVQRVPPPGRPAAAKAKGFGSVSKR